MRKNVYMPNIVRIFTHNQKIKNYESTHDTKSKTII